MINILFLLCLLLSVTAKSDTFEKVSEDTVKIKQTKESTTSMNVNELKKRLEMAQRTLDNWAANYDKNLLRLTEARDALQEQLDGAASVGVVPKEKIAPVLQLNQ